MSIYLVFLCLYMQACLASICVICILHLLLLLSFIVSDPLYSVRSFQRTYLQHLLCFNLILLSDRLVTYASHYLRFSARNWKKPNAQSYQQGVVLQDAPLSQACRGQFREMNHATEHHGSIRWDGLSPYVMESAIVYNSKDCG